MANGHGGKRPGAGRPRNQEKYAEQIARFHDQVASAIDARYAALRQLADGGFAEVTETWEPAGLVTVNKEVISEDGRSMNVRELAFPHLPPEQLVCIRRVTSIAAPDRQANIYLIDRLAGKPVQAIEADLDPDGSLEVGAAAMEQAARELAAWRKQMTEQLNTQNAPPTLPTSPTST